MTIGGAGSATKKIFYAVWTTGAFLLCPVPFPVGRAAHTTLVFVIGKLSGWAEASESLSIPAGAGRARATLFSFRIPVFVGRAIFNCANIESPRGQQH